MALTLDPSGCSRSHGPGRSVLELTSGAGHDAQMMARIAPSAMFLVASRALAIF